MKTFAVTLEGFNPDTDETDHLIKWINASYIEKVEDFCELMQWKYDSIIELELYYATMDSGVNFIIDD